MSSSSEREDMTVIGDRASMECFCRSMVLRQTSYQRKWRMSGPPRMLLRGSSTA